MDRLEKKKRKKFFKNRKKRPEYKLHLLWNKETKKLEPKDLVFIVSKQDYPVPFRKRALREFLTRINLTFDIFEKMLNAVRDILKTDDSLREQFYKQCFSICTEINLVELGDAEAVKELIQRVKNGSAKNSNGLRALIFFFGITTEPSARMKLWRIIKEFNPTEKDVIDLYNVVYGKYGFHEVLADIQRFLKKKGREKTKRTLRKIEELVAQIKQKQE